LEPYPRFKKRNTDYLKWNGYFVFSFTQWTKMKLLEVISFLFKLVEWNCYFVPSRLQKETVCNDRLKRERWNEFVPNNPAYMDLFVMFALILVLYWAFRQRKIMR
jgi:hypothetical protein